MDGLEEQAEAVVDSIVEQLFDDDTTTATVQIKHSSRELVIDKVCEALKDSAKVITAKKLVLRSGITLTGLQKLEEALLVQRANSSNKENKSSSSNSSSSSIQELEFVCLQDAETLRGAINCCRRCGIKRLCLRYYNAQQRVLVHGQRTMQRNRDAVSETVRSCLMLYDDGTANHNDDKNDKKQKQNNKGVVAAAAEQGLLEYLEIVSYPIGAEGSRLIADAICATGLKTTLQTLKLIDCDLRSDSATYIAQIIRVSKSLEIMDLSYNRHFPGSQQITRELTFSTLLRGGLQHHNINLLHLQASYPRRGNIYSSGGGGGSSDNCSSSPKIKKQLQVNRFYKRYLDTRRLNQQQQPGEGEGSSSIMGIHPCIWCHILAKVSSKPTILYLLLQDSVGISTLLF